MGVFLAFWSYLLDGRGPSGLPALGASLRQHAQRGCFRQAHWGVVLDGAEPVAHFALQFMCDAACIRSPRSARCLDSRACAINSSSCGAWGSMSGVIVPVQVLLGRGQRFYANTGVPGHIGDGRSRCRAHCASNPLRAFIVPSLRSADASGPAFRSGLRASLACGRRVRGPMPCPGVFPDSITFIATVARGRAPSRRVRPCPRCAAGRT